MQNAYLKKRHESRRGLLGISGRMEGARQDDGELNIILIYKYDIVIMKAIILYTK
jgi:hypothetical protein